MFKGKGNFLKCLEQMLNQHNELLIKDNSILGFCAKLLTLKPMAEGNFKEELKNQLLDVYPKRPKRDFDLIFVNLAERTSWRFSLLVGGIALFFLALTTNQEQANQTAKLNKLINPENQAKIEKVQIINEIQKREVIQAQAGLELVEYTDLNGQRIKALENNIF